MTDAEILHRWQPMLNYIGTNCTIPVKPDKQLECALALQNFETKTIKLLGKDKSNTVLKRMLPIIRKSFTNSNNNRFDDCSFYISKSPSSDEIIITVNDWVFEQQAKMLALVTEICVADTDLFDFLDFKPIL